MNEPSEFDRKCASWVRVTFPGSNPALGSVVFEDDWAAYSSAAWHRLDVTWQEPSVMEGDTVVQPWRSVTKRLADADGDIDVPEPYDLPRLLRELIEAKL